MKSKSRKVRNLSLSRFSALALMLLGFRLSAASPDPKVIVTASTDANQVYVHAQLVLTIELRSDISIRNGSLSKPDIKDAIVETLQEDEQRDVVVNGVKTRIFVRSYAIFAAEPGTLTIPSIVFEGMAAETGGGGWNGFFGRGRHLRASSKPLAIEVKAVPAAFPKGQAFLPAKSLTVIESFDDENPQLSVNKALTRRFEIRALGSLASFLPAIKAPHLAGMQVYTENGTKSQKVTPDGLLASVNFSHVYLPSQGGAVSIPEHVIYWWDTDLDQLKSTPIRALEFQVRGEAAAQAEQAVPQKPDALPLPPQMPDTSVLTRISPGLAALFFVLWVATLLLYVVRKPKSSAVAVPGTDSPKLSVLKAAVMSACDEQCGPKVLRSLALVQKWSLQNGADQELYEQLGRNMRMLEDALYGPKNEDVAKAFIEVKKLTASLKLSPAKPASLPALYPL